MPTGPDHPLQPSAERVRESEVVHQLKNLPGAKVEVDSETGSLMFTVEDKEKWQDAIAKESC